VVFGGAAEYSWNLHEIGTFSLQVYGIIAFIHQDQHLVEIGWV
jgi:hypothetical protein